MKTLVIYHTRGGNTRRLAEEIARGAASVEGVECALKSAREVAEDDLLSARAIVAGSPVYFGSMAAELKAVFDRFVYLRKKMTGKVGAAFATSGFHSGGKETTMMSIIQAFLINGMIVIGDPPDASGHYGVACSGPMNAETADHARKLGRRAAALAKALEIASPETERT
jgi:NAD(P)H dehydrogenase (quinone)